ncbi:class I SAM-dependent methyltransferase [Oceanisphaera arctica]|uniref:Methyltransferase domain-containing protein n=1 Tax=Oceanisphaera arctica TaxID=641510 RepID=A0A2P5TR40_9GAMM|nr:class I SAM-dependent methyltransferase [Oceanisphaera arctica]PPL18260.1 hypothetical protein UN63_01755 [Oceanisphaera arctica]GHA12378.1 hypothetical protein GCM10007082_11670 [Oceanisphaera arctica]
MQYQSFPGVKGSSTSLQKLAALRLPSLTGKRFLDVGCNEGFFCGYALFNCASQVVGMDKSAHAISKASVRFPDAEFINQSWDSLPTGPFDVITLLSALHYAEDQAELIHKLMALLADNGLLVLELSLAPGKQDEWVKVKRAIDERYFPTRNKLNKILQGYAWKVIGHSVMQAGDPQQRYVVHIRKFKPYAWLLMQEPASGKSTISRRMFGGKPDTKIISGDHIYQQMSQGEFELSHKMRNLVAADFSTATIDKTTLKVLEQGLAGELAQLWADRAGFRDFVLDSYVPAEYRQQIKAALQSLGYFPVEVSWDDYTPLTKVQESTNSARQYETYLKKEQSALACECVRVSKQLKKELKTLIQWHLDSPGSGKWCTGTETICVAGWAVTRDYLKTSYRLYVSGPEGEAQFTPEKTRTDVLDDVFGSAETAPAFWQDHPCGFSFELPASWLESGFELGLVIHDARIPLAHIAISQPKAVSLSTQLVQGLKWLWG